MRLARGLYGVYRIETPKCRMKSHVQWRPGGYYTLGRGLPFEGSDTGVLEEQCCNVPGDQRLGDLRRIVE